MKTVNNICVSFAKCILAVISYVGVATAGHITVTYQTFPSGPILDSNITTACESATAKSFLGYEFLFWDNQGSISWSPTVSICAGATDTVATAWYLQTCVGPCVGGPCPPPGCYVTTFAFSTDHNEVLARGTPILMVNPNSPVAWASPSTTVLTTNPLGESITAKSTLAFPPHAAEPFRYWQQLGTSAETPISKVYNASSNSTAWVIAFYGPDPCQLLENELAACEEELGSKACAPLAAEVHACMVTNREIPPTP